MRFYLYSNGDILLCNSDRLPADCDVNVELLKWLDRDGVILSAGDTIKIEYVD